MLGECSSTLPVGSILQHKDTFLGQASIESLSYHPSPEENAAHAKNLAATGRQYWKTRGNQGEAIWPPHVEIALLEGLGRYQKDTWKPIRDHRCPMRNKFISEHIEKTTGVFRTPRQISSRIQHLRDTCQTQSIVDLIAPSKPEGIPTSPSRTSRRTPLGRRGNPYPRLSKSRRTTPHSRSPRVASPPVSEINDSALSPENQIAEPVPIRPQAPPPILTVPLSHFLPEANPYRLPDSRTPQRPTCNSDLAPPQDATRPCRLTLQYDSPMLRTLTPSFNVDVLLDNTVSSIPLVPLAGLDDLEPLQISLGSHENQPNSLGLDTVVQLVSPCPLHTRTVLSVFVSGRQTSIYTEAKTLLCNSIPIWGTDWFYTFSLLSSDFWGALNDAADLEDYTIQQTIEPQPLHPQALADGLSYHNTGTKNEPSKIIICYRFRSTRPPFTSLRFSAQTHPLGENSSVWLPHSNLEYHRYSDSFHQNTFPMSSLLITPFSSTFGGVTE